jgi:fumarate hydratase subunit beta
MAVFRLTTPISEGDVRKLRINDILYVTGTIFTARDQAHKRALEFLMERKILPIQTRGLAVFHCGPIVKRENGEWKVVAAGPTTSMRMEALESDFIKALGVRVVIGKGGMGPKTTETMKSFGAVYGAFTGGAAALAAKSVKKVRGVEWLDLGMPEALWILEVEDFGPLTVAIDSHGNNLYSEVMRRAERNRDEIYRKVSM